MNDKEKEESKEKEGKKTLNHERKIKDHGILVSLLKKLTNFKKKKIKERREGKFMIFVEKFIYV